MDNKKRDTVFFTILLKILVFSRFFFGPTIFFFPRFTSIMSFVLDWIDSYFFRKAGYAYSQYSKYDKVLDYYWYIWIFLYVLAVDIPLKFFLLALFFYRSIGQALYLNTRKRYLLFIFPNFFEVVFWYVLFATSPGIQSSMYLNTPTLWYSLILIGIFVVMREFAIHLRKNGIFTGNAGYWPSFDFNPYKVLIVFSFIIAVFATYTFIYQPERITYTNQAKRASRDGQIISYDPVGRISGLIKSEAKDTIQASLFDDQSFSTPVCTTNILPYQLTDIQEGETLFAVSSGCLANLSDDTYYLLFSITEDKSAMIEFTVVGGKLQ